MSQAEKLKEKFYEKPVRNDITIDEVKKLAEWYGCGVKSGGKHPLIVMDPDSGRIVPIPCHGKYVKEAYIRQLKALFDEIEARNT